MQHSKHTSQTLPNKHILNYQERSVKEFNTLTQNLQATNFFSTQGYGLVVNTVSWFKSPLTQYLGWRQHVHIELVKAHASHPDTTINQGGSIKNQTQTQIKTIHLQNQYAQGSNIEFQNFLVMNINLIITPQIIHQKQHQIISQNNYHPKATSTKIGEKKNQFNPLIQILEANNFTQSINPSLPFLLKQYNQGSNTQTLQYSP